MLLFGVDGTQLAKWDEDENVDEIKRILGARYVLESECCCRIFHMPLHKQSPTVMRLSVNFNNKRKIYYNEKDNMLDMYFEL